MAREADGGGMRGWLVAILLIALPGCMGSASSPSAVLEPGPSTLPAGNGTYWFVEVSGEEAAKEGGPISDCDRSFFFEIDREAHGVQYDPRRRPYDPGFVASLVTFDVDYLGGCPLLYGMQANDDAWPRDLGVLGMVGVYVEDESGVASVSVDGEYVAKVPPGQQLRLSGDGERQAVGTEWEAHGEALIVNHGAWPRSGLVPTVDGPSW